MGLEKRLFLLFAFLTGFGLLFAQTPTVGVIAIDTGFAPGYNLIAGADAEPIYLIDNCGREINSWKNSPYTQGIAAYFAEDGTLYRTCRIPNNNFALGGLGGRIERWSWDDQLLWAFDYSTANYVQHHDIEVMPNGNVLILATEKKTNLAAISEGRDPSLVASTGELWSEFLVEVQPVGTDSGIIVWEWHVWDHLVQDFDSSRNNYGVVADHPELMDLNFVPGTVKADWLHANAVDYNPWLDQVMISMGESSEIWIIDHGTTTQEAAGNSGGPRGKGGDILFRWGNPQVYQRGDTTDQQFSYQHHAHWIQADSPDSGKVMVFNNGRIRDYSSVDIIDPPVTSPGNYAQDPVQPYGPALPEFSYTSDSLTDFFSKIMSSGDQLPNGNLLVCVGAKGENFEVTPNREIVWEYINPVSRLGIVPQGDPVIAGTNGMFRITRYAPDYPGFQGLVLAPGVPIEGFSDLTDCLNVLQNREVDLDPETVSLVPNPATSGVQVHFAGGMLPYRIVDVLGRERIKGKVSPSQICDISSLETGIYWLILNNRSAFKFIKTEP